MCKSGVSTRLHRSGGDNASLKGSRINAIRPNYSGRDLNMVMGEKEWFNENFEKRTPEVVGSGTVIPLYKIAAYLCGIGKDGKNYILKTLHGVIIPLIPQLIF